MQCHNIIRWRISLICFATLTACGGGGDGGSGGNVSVGGGGSTVSGGGGGSSQGADRTLTATQQTAQNIYAEANNGIYFFNGGLPSAGNPINSSVHYVTATQYSISGSMSDQPQILKQAVGAVAGSLSVATPVPTSRVLVNGSFYGGILFSSPAVTERLSLIDGDVLSELVENGIVLTAARYTAIEGVPLVGTITATPTEARDSGGAFAQLIALPVALRPGANYLPGAMYYKRKSVREQDVVFMDDCGNVTPTQPASPTPCGSFTRIEDLFSSSVVGPFTGGTIQTLQGLRAWVSNAPQPTNANPTPTAGVYVERAGRVYHGTLYRRGETTDSIRFNKQAVDSLKAAVTF